MKSPRSRRRVLQLFGGAASVFTAGCFDWLTRNAADSRHRSVSESSPEHSKASFEAYTARMRERHGKQGVWGIEKSGTDRTGSDAGQLSFVGAWSGEWTLRKGATEGRGTGTEKGTKKGTRTGGNGGQFRVPVDYAVVLYRVRGRTDEHDRPVHRLWLWTAATPKQSDTGYGSTTLGGLSIGAALNASGALGPYAPETQLKSDDAPVQIGLSSPEAPTALHPIPAGRIRPPPNTATGSNARFAVEWTGAYGPTISVAGVCEIRRSPDREYEFTLTNEANGTQGTL